jgi:hypothetical protein
VPDEDTNQPSLAPLFEALAAATADGWDVPKNREANAGTYSYRYADLADILKVVQPRLAAHGLAVMQFQQPDNGGILIRTRLCHASGAYVDSPGLWMPAGGKPQDIGSSLTYGRRYDLCATLGIAPEDDDDGQRAQKSAPARESQPAANGQAQKPSGELASGVHTIQKVEVKTGEKDGEAWKRYGVKIEGGWVSTFNSEIGEAAKQLEGQDARLTIAKKGKYHDLEGVQPAAGDEPQGDADPADERPTPKTVQGVIEGVEQVKTDDGRDVWRLKIAGLSEPVEGGWGTYDPGLAAEAEKHAGTGTQFDITYARLGKNSNAVQQLIPSDEIPF